MFLCFFTVPVLSCVPLVCLTLPSLYKGQPAWAILVRLKLLLLSVKFCYSYCHGTYTLHKRHMFPYESWLWKCIGRAIFPWFFLSRIVCICLEMLGNVTKHHGNMALPISTFAKEMCRKYIPFVQWNIHVWDTVRTMHNRHTTNQTQMSCSNHQLVTNHVNSSHTQQLRHRWILSCSCDHEKLIADCSLVDNSPPEEDWSIRSKRRQHKFLRYQVVYKGTVSNFSWTKTQHTLRKEWKWNHTHNKTQ